MTFSHILLPTGGRFICHPDWFLTVESISYLMQDDNLPRKLMFAADLYPLLGAAAMAVFIWFVRRKTKISMVILVLFDDEKTVLQKTNFLSTRDCS